MTRMCSVLSLLSGLLLAVSIRGVAAESPPSPRSTAGDPDDIYWDTTIATIGGGLNGPITALAVCNGKLIVAGEFTTVGGISANHIAAWDGQVWSPLESGINSPYSALIIYRGQVVAGHPYGAVAWDGSSWSPLGSEIVGLLPDFARWSIEPADFAVMNDTLFAAWNGVVRSEFRDYAVGEVLCWDGGFWKPYAEKWAGIADGGGLEFQGQIVWNYPCQYSDRGDCTSTSCGGPMTVWDDKLIQISHFAYGGLMCSEGAYSELSAWDGLRSVTLVQVPDYTAFSALGNYGQWLIVGGYGPGNIAQWDGSSMLPLGSGLDGAVTAFVTYNFKLVVGGSFTTAGGKVSRYLAQWTKAADSDGDSVVDSVDNCLRVPNPLQTDTDADGVGDACDDCPAVANMDQADADGDGIGDVCDECTDTDGDGFANPGYAANTCSLDNCPDKANPGQEDTNGDGVGDACCCMGRVGDANGSGEDEPTIGDVSSMIDAKFITGTCEGILPCLQEADMNKSGGANPTCDDITIGDIAMLIYYLFITGPSLGLPDCE